MFQLRISSIRRLTTVAFIALITCATVAPSAHAQTIATGNHLENAKVGFGGFRVDVPSAYAPYTPEPTPAPVVDPMTGNLVPAPENKWITPAELTVKEAGPVGPNKKGFNVLDRFLYSAPDRGFAVLLMQSPGRVPSLKQKKRYLDFLQEVTNTVSITSENSIVRDVREINGVQVGRVGKIVKRNFVACGIVMIPPRSFVMIIGAGPAVEQDAVLADLDAALATFSLGSKKNP